MKVCYNNGLISFLDKDSRVHLTSLNGLSAVQTDTGYSVFYGTKGRAYITKDVFEEIHATLGIAVPADDSDNDLTVSA